MYLLSCVAHLVRDVPNHAISNCACVRSSSLCICNCNQIRKSAWVEQLAYDEIDDLIAQNTAEERTDARMVYNMAGEHCATVRRRLLEVITLSFSIVIDTSMFTMVYVIDLSCT